MPVIGGINLPVQTQERCWELLIRRISTPPGYPWLAEAIEAGFLHCVLKSAAENRNLKHVKMFLSSILPFSLISASVLTQLKTAFIDVQDLADSPQFTSSSSFEL
ncbi:hypothetical protein B0H16DRAFT_1714623 [Mycena metata]|uniref:Uncharacterized protein n=1 Tax=Mycena metata TaxID=1033252 RepID=A0AAD7JUS7_9AGAR|nr:hypothetical protein B0H16DRAFT_1714623 [Mycena metata]